MQKRFVVGAVDVSHGPISEPCSWTRPFDLGEVVIIERDAPNEARLGASRAGV